MQTELKTRKELHINLLLRQLWQQSKLHITKNDYYNHNAVVN